MKPSYLYATAIIITAIITVGIMNIIDDNTVEDPDIIAKNTAEINNFNRINKENVPTPVITSRPITRNEALDEIQMPHYTTIYTTDSTGSYKTIQDNWDNNKSITTREENPYGI